MGKQYQTIVLLVLGLLLTSFLGFYPTYFRFFPAFENTSWVVHFHVFVVICWFAMLVVQATLAKNGRISLHRKIGVLSYILVPLILLSFVLIMNEGQMKQKSPDLIGAVFFDVSLFLVFYLLAIYYRKKTAYHARFMMLSALPFLNPGLGRFLDPGISLTVEFLLLLGFFLVTYFRKKIYQPYLVGLSCFFLSLGVVVYVSLVNPAILEWVWMAIWG